MEALIEAASVNVRIGSAPILRDIGFRVEQGTLVALLGPNGSGKTTLLKALAGLLPYEGTLLLAGTPVRSWKARDLARQLAFVRQAPSLTFEFTVAELVLLGRSPHKGLLDPVSHDDTAQVQRALREVDLDGFEERSVLTLSGGELQRVFLAQALVQETGLLLLDEPTAHLDIHYQFDLLERIRALVASGRTCVAVLHDLDFAARFADAVIVLQDGRVAAAGTPRDVLTEELIASVFRMRAHIRTEDGRMSISYAGRSDGGEHIARQSTG